MIQIVRVRFGWQVLGHAGEDLGTYPTLAIAQWVARWERWTA